MAETKMNFMLRTSVSSTLGGPPILLQGLWQMLQNNSAICGGPAKVIIIVIPPRPLAPPPSPLPLAVNDGGGGHRDARLDTKAYNNIWLPQTEGQDVTLTGSKCHDHNCM